MREQDLYERRKHPRYQHQAEITLRQAVTGPHLTGTLRDISLEGCLIQVDAPIKLRLSDVIELKVRSSPSAVRLMGFVRHTSEDGCIAGLEFFRIGERDSQNLNNFLSTLAPRSDSAPMLADA